MAELLNGENGETGKNGDKPTYLLSLFGLPGYALPRYFCANICLSSKSAKTLQRQLRQENELFVWFLQPGAICPQKKSPQFSRVCLGIRILPPKTAEGALHSAQIAGLYLYGALEQSYFK